MRVRNYLVLVVMVCTLGGLALGAFLLERQRVFDQQNANLSLRVQQQYDVQRFADQIKQLLLSSDLLFGSMETYMLAPSLKQGEAALAMCSTVYRGLGDNDSFEKAKLKQIHGLLDQLNVEVLLLRDQSDQSSFHVGQAQLARVDDAAIGLVIELESLQQTIAKNLEVQQVAVLENRSNFDVLGWVAVAFYLLCVLGALWWASRSVSQPLRQLTDSARRSLDDDAPFAVQAHGPQEVQALADHIGQFVGSLEANIAQNKALINAIPDTLFVVHRDHGITNIKPGIDTPTTMRNLQPTWPDLQNLLADDQTETILKHIKICLQQQIQQHFDIALGVDDKQRYYEARATPISADEVVIVIRDLTAKRRAESRIRHMAYHDGLTGLLNRRAFKESLSRYFESFPVAPFALLYVDVDRFKTINDTQGHDVGDVVLQHVTRCLSQCLRGDDTLGAWSNQQKEISARIGGDEFVILLPSVGGVKGAESVANRLLAAMATPFHHDQTRVVVTVSIGVALYPLHGETDDALMNHADLAMFEAKRSGGDTFHIYDQSMGDRNRRKLSMETKLREALVNNDLFLVYQPKVDLRTRQIVGAEALVRWRDGDKVIPPDEFIPLAEETGLILPLGEFVTDTALGQVGHWRRQGLLLDHIAINVSAAQLKQDGFCASVCAAAAKAGLDHSMVNIEITESLLMGQYTTALKVLTDLHEFGFTIAMDDFGTGYSSLSYIKDLPLDMLKIDRAFVSGITDSETERAIIAAIIQLGQTLGLRIVAEGVETVDQAHYLEQSRCDEAQGYLFSPPVSAEQFERLFLEQLVSKQAGDRRLGMG